MHTPIFRTEEPLWFLLETAWCSQTQMGLSESTVWDLQSLMGAHQMWTLGDAGMGPSEMPAARREAQLAAARDMLFVPRRRARSLDRALLLAEEYGQNKKWKELTREQVEERRALEEKRRCEERQLEVSVTTGGQDDPPPGLDPISVLCHHTRQKRYSF
ncbi:hypothetical protein FJT64_024026 [Amphibalanus amphitrite]|uniref:Uncharacterized protein n=1 Tax=Amphibalanus amphitrite TaxID=1232801 RepID=A0A6A4WN75_AMPAM|nr:hypothetical protein FJT64_024026 [Amphibalanus amphitrite]